MKIKSVSDVITNSSTEVFVIRTSDPLFSKLKDIIDEWDEFPDLESIRNVVLSEDYYRWDSIYSITTSINDCPAESPMYDVFETVERTPENWEKYKDLYKSVCGAAYLVIDRDQDKYMEVRDAILQDHIEKHILPIIETMIPGKKYSAYLKFENQKIEFLFSGDIEVVISGEYFNPYKVDLITLLNYLIKPESLHEN